MMILGMKLPVEYGLDGVHWISKAGFGAIQVSVLHSISSCSFFGLLVFVLTGSICRCRHIVGRVLFPVTRQGDRLAHLPNSQRTFGPVPRLISWLHSVSNPTARVRLALGANF